MSRCRPISPMCAGVLCVESVFKYRFRRSIHFCFLHLFANVAHEICAVTNDLLRIFYILVLIHVFLTAIGVALACLLLPLLLRNFFRIVPFA